MERLCAYMSRRLIEKLIYEKKRLDHRTFPFRRDRFIILDPNCPFLREILPAVLLLSFLYSRRCVFIFTLLSRIRLNFISENADRLLSA